MLRDPLVPNERSDELPDAPPEALLDVDTPNEVAPEDAEEPEEPEEPLDPPELPSAELPLPELPEEDEPPPPPIDELCPPA